MTRDVGVVGRQPVRAEVHARVALHADEVVAAGGAQEDVLEHLFRRIAQALPALAGRDLGHGERETDREVAGPGPQHVDGQSVRAHHRLVDRPVTREVVLHPGRVLTLEVPHDGDDVGLVDGAGPSDQVTEISGRPLHEAGKALGGVGCLPSPAGGEPQRGREVVEGDDGQDPVAVTGGTHSAVVLQRGDGELPFGGLNAAPLQREAVGAEAHVGHELEVLAPAVKGVTRVTARLNGARRRVVFPRPPVVVHVSALNLVRRRGDAPGEARWELEHRLLALPSRHCHAAAG